MPHSSKLEKLQRLLSNIKRDYAPAAFATHFGVEDMLLMDVIYKNHPEIDVVAIDSGRLPEETYTLMQQAKQHYGRTVTLYFPSPMALQEYNRGYGPNGFYDGKDLRKMCCRIRLQEPLNQALKGKNSWISGHACCSDISLGVPHMNWDSVHEMPRFNPLYAWTIEQIWDYIHEFGVPFNILHTNDYPVIGCNPCTRAVTKNSENPAAQWWWEQTEATLDNNTAVLLTTA